MFGHSSLWVYPSEICWASWICKLISVNKFGKLWLLFLQIFFPAVISFFSLYEIPVTYMVDLLVGFIFLQVLEAFHLLQSFFLFFRLSNFYWSILHFLTTLIVELAFWAKSQWGKTNKTGNLLPHEGLYLQVLTLVLHPQLFFFVFFSKRFWFVCFVDR